MSCYVSDMYEDKSGLRELNVNKKLPVCSPRPLLMIVIPRRCVGYACSRS